MRGARRLSVLITLLAFTTVAGSTAAEHPMMGQPAPAFELPTLDGGQLASANLRGQFIVLHFGAGW